MLTKPTKKMPGKSEAIAILCILRDIPDPGVERTRIHKLFDA